MPGQDGATLNGIFGFMTIIAAIEAAKEVFKAGPLHTDPAAFLFFVYFILFRTKMYVDDLNHKFGGSNFAELLDSFIAVISWLLFIFSAAALNGSLVAAVEWFCVALIVSVVWCVVSDLRKLGDHNRYLLFAFFNILHIAVLYVAVLAPDLPGAVPLLISPCVGFSVLIAAVVFEWWLQRRNATKAETLQTRPD